MIVFTNGIFDILHIGHVRYLKQSRDLGDRLVIGINSDRSASQLKGPTRPINNQDIRREMLLSLRWVDEVIIFDELTPLELIKSVKPDIITKGGDYKTQDVVGNHLARTVIMPYHNGHSTTYYENFIDR